ncbi:site-2 protease family protein [Polynucleobacter necessarius]|uniref:site-2 protease family protein n=1 Tax=Polynucleobacter necessarius TaxID=576610 RepID=UPI001E2FBBD0|nr:site-2 protease family protein [Polynucleobacter necessarius]
MQAFITLGTFIITLGVLVSFHEFGHFVAARACGVRVLRFAIGFGKPLFTYCAKNKTEWVIAAIPLGGYVKLLDGRDKTQDIAPNEQIHAFDQKPPWQRSLIVAAGPLANFLLAIILFSTIYMSGAPQLPAVLQTPPDSSLAFKLGVTGGEQIVGWQVLESKTQSLGPISDEFEPVLSWNALRWLLMDALAGEYGFALQLKAPDGNLMVKTFLAEDLPPMRQDSDPMLRLGLLLKPTL